MFKKKKKCPNCGRPVQEDWEFCPYCGYPLKEKYGSVNLEEKFEEEFGFEDIDKLVNRIEKEFEEFLRVPAFRIPKIKFSEPKFSGISITVHTATGMKPKIEIRTYGDYKKLEPEIKKKLGVKVPVEEEEYEREEYAPPKITEEPEAKVSKENGKTIIEIKLPDVEKEEDIQIKKLEQSIEIRAKAKDKLYFKLIPISGNIINKKFEKGTLKIEIS